MFVITYQKIFLTLSAVFVAVGLGFIVAFGLTPGIDFTGGSALGLSFADVRPETTVLKERADNVGFSDALIQTVGDKGISVKTRDLTDAERAYLIAALTDDGREVATQESFTTIGPSVGSELKRKAILSIVLVLISIICFVAYAFRKVSTPVSSWKYGLAVIIALAHDIIIPAGVFALLGHLIGAEVDTLFVVALLTTLALSVSDTIVVFDRVRENLPLMKGASFSSVVGESLSQTFARSINTSLVVLVMVVALALFGPSSTRLFATVLAIGMFFGTYSSIFLASPLLVLMAGKGK
ncbi:protein translocase subunit SecF [Candidatus Nomurabacteria bacterium]|nr:protein translocase subunit SecF [Candidatus Nomurabacteria bacterium]